MQLTRHRGRARAWAGAVFGTVLAGLAVLPATADKVGETYHQDYISGTPDDPSEAWLMANGGRIYDSWFEALDTEEPEATHPAWPASNTKKTGAVTWRCKSCHGWDYSGKDGAYAKGSYKTGIKGVRASAGRDPAAIAALLRGPLHGFTEAMIPDDALARVAAFISRGQIDVAPHVNADKSVNGDAERGKPVFQTVCAACHGFDGRALNFGDDDDPEYVGTIGQDNPWEGLHKIRAGHPGVEMPALMALPVDYAVDVLSYTQTLPAK